MEALNILDLSRRKVVCVNSELTSVALEKGKEYTLTWVNAMSGKSNISLEEFPNDLFLAINFAEVEGYQKPGNEPTFEEVRKLHKMPACYAAERPATTYAKLQAYLEAAGRPLKMIFKGEKLPKIKVTAFIVVDLNRHKSEIDSLKKGEIFTIGSNDSTFKVNIKFPSAVMSRVQAYVVKTSAGYEVYDVSLNGTTVTDEPENEEFHLKYFEEIRRHAIGVDILELYAARKNRPIRGIFNGKKLPKINCAGEEVVDLAQYQSKIDDLREDEAFVIGRDNSVVRVHVTIENTHISSVHAYVTKSSAGYKIYDMSLNGTTIVEEPQTGLKNALKKLFSKG